MKQLRRLLPYYTPYRADLAPGLVLVVLSTAITSVMPILRALRDALSARTAVIASHRVSAIRDAAWIIVLDEGRDFERGRHDELMMAEGRYWTLLRRQQLVDSIEGAESRGLAFEGAGNG